ncbi:MAG: ABC transporter substrate-binding protein [Lachnospiraceae bacterium]|jgi:spermidine/putrescine transport system substrate-binding protein|nr:ABC transporter substrate-binding protein [Lachnospiraceae bacterium]
MKKRWIAAALAVCLVFGICGCGGGEEKESKGQVKIFNWGEYIDEEVIEMFEEETGIEVVYDTFETNEAMYPIIEAGGVSYDAICPSDYMIEKLLANDLLAKLNFDNIPNVKYVSDGIMEGSKTFDPENEYSVPYTFGTLGILYNTALIDDEIDSWEALWNEEYKGNILMYNSPRDLFVAPLEILGYSINTTDEAELSEAKNLLLEQKPLLQRYVMDQIKDSMISGSASIAMCYSGEVLQLQAANPDLKYVVPKEGSNYFIDSWVIPANAENKENAEAWINFLNKPEIALKNFEYITYSTPNTGAQELLDEELLKNPAVFPGEDILSKCEVFHSLGTDGDALFNDLWLQLRDAQ